MGDMMSFENDVEKINMQKIKKIVIAFFIIGVILMYAVINSVYNTYYINSDYIETDAVCIGEKERYR